MSMRRAVTSCWRSEVMPRQEKKEMEQEQKQILKDSPSKEQGEEADDVSGNPE